MPTIEINGVSHSDEPSAKRAQILRPIRKYVKRELNKMCSMFVVAVVLVEMVAHCPANDII